jgi:hypothetical protein
MKTLSQDSWCLSKDSNRVPPKFKVEVSLLEPTCSALFRATSLLETAIKSVHTSVHHIGFFLYYACCSHSEHRASVKRSVSLQFFNLRKSVGLLG